MDHTAIISNYFNQGLLYKEIVLMLHAHHGVDISVRHVKRVLRFLNLGRRLAYSELNEVVAFVSNELTHSGMLHGYRWMHQKCLSSEYNVRREHVRMMLKCLDPDAVTVRRSRRLHRRAYFARGPNFIWHIDSYDKLKYFGFCINGCIDGFSRRMMWLNVYTTSSDPKIIGGYFIDTVRDRGCCPKLVRTDDGTENVVVLQLQRYFRRQGSDSFAGDKSALTGASTHNQRIECWWGMRRKQCVEFWLVLLHDLKNVGDFDGRWVDINLLQFSLMSVIQNELDDVVNIWNSHNIRRNRNALVPSGRPDSLYFCPEIRGAHDEGFPIVQGDIPVCERHCSFRKSMSCEDKDIYDLCVLLMSRHNYRIATNAIEGLHLYKLLRSEILSML